MKFLRKVRVVTFAVFAFLSSVLYAKNVVICQIVEHTALNQMREGIIQELSGKNIKWFFENAQGNPTIASQIGQKVAGEDFDLVIALATPMAQAIASTNTNNPVLFGAVSDPVSAKLVKTMEEPGANISGLTDTIPVSEAIEVIKEVISGVKSIGIVYNAGEANSVVQARKIKELAKEHNIEIIEATVSKSSDVLAATKHIITRVDAILLPTDNTVISALEAITKPALLNKVPVIGMDVDVVKRGALAAVGVDWNSQGHQLGKMALDVLDGSLPGSMPVQTPSRYFIHVNLSVADEIGLSIPKSLLDKADKTFPNK